MRAAPFAMSALLFALGASEARADEPPPPERWALDPARVKGIDRAPSQPGDFGRSVLGAVLWFPRQAVDYVFLATDAAAGVVTNQQIVPRVEELVTPRPGGVVFFPTAFAETGRAANIGARMIATGHNVTTSLRGGFGGVDDVVGEAKIRLVRTVPLPSVLSLEWLGDSRSGLEFLGVGQAPGTDARNLFRPGGPSIGLYRERRSRAIGSLGIRPIPNVEVFLSTSFTRRSVDDQPDAGDAALSRAFAPQSIPGALKSSTIVYSELAMRLDTRPSAGKPSPGGVLEGYAGTARGVDGDHTHYLRLGGRAAAFIPIYRRYNILSPKIVVDALDVQGPVPFTELPGEPEFRGFDSRRDNVSVVASLDYRYAFMKPLAARAFFDASTVAPRVSALGLDHLRFAVGVGIDLSSPSAELGRFAVAVSPEGFRVLLSFGVPSGFGDRQHRD